MGDMTMKVDVLIAGTGCSGLYLALNLPKNKSVLMITKSDCESSDSFLAQGGMCVLTSDSDYDSYFEDTMKAGHYENDKKSVEIMIKSSPQVVEDLVRYGARFHREEDGSLSYTREGAHSANRIVFHKDVTGKEITRTLLSQVRQLPNVTIMEHTRLLDLISKENVCLGGVIRDGDGNLIKVRAQTVVLATGGIGGLYRHSTNFRHLTGDALAMAIRHKVELKNINYVQIHPTTLYSEKEEDRSFLISESARGEGAKLYDKNGQRFVYELMPRDLLTNEIRKQMEKDHTKFVWEDLREIPRQELLEHFPNITKHCKKVGYDVTAECIPVVPAQHYFMGGIKVNYESKTTMENLYAVGETACNGVHGRNRLASNSLLESLVFARRAAVDMTENVPVPFTEEEKDYWEAFNENNYLDEERLDSEYRKLVKDAIKEAEEQEKEEGKINV